MNNVPLIILELVFDFFNTTHDCKQLLNISLVSKQWNALNTNLEHRRLIKNFSQLTLPYVMSRRSLRFVSGAFVIDMCDLINYQVSTIKDAGIVFNILCPKHGVLITISTIVNLLIDADAKKKWLSFFETLNPNIYNAVVALFNVPPSNVSFLFIDS